MAITRKTVGQIQIVSGPGDPNDQGITAPAGSIYVSSAGTMWKYCTSTGVWVAPSRPCPSPVPPNFYVYGDRGEMLAAEDTWQDGDVIVLSDYMVVYRYFEAVLENRGLIPLEPFGPGRGAINSVTRLDGIEAGQDYTAAGWSLTTAGPTFTYYPGYATYVTFTSGQFFELTSGVNLTSADTATMTVVEDYWLDGGGSYAGLLQLQPKSYIDASNYGDPHFRLNPYSTNYDIAHAYVYKKNAAGSYVGTADADHDGSEKTIAFYSIYNRSATFYASVNGSTGSLATDAGLVVLNLGGFTSGSDPTVQPAATFNCSISTANTSARNLSFGRVGVYRLEVV